MIEFGESGGERQTGTERDTLLGQPGVRLKMIEVGSWERVVPNHLGETVLENERRRWVLV